MMEKKEKDNDMALLNTKYLVGLGSNHMENTVLLRIC